MSSTDWQYNQQDDDVSIVLVLISIIVNSYNHVFGYDLRYSFRDEWILAWLNMHPANCGLNYYVTGIFINRSIFQENPHYKMSIMLDHFYIKMGFLKNNNSACPPPSDTDQPLWPLDYYINTRLSRKKQSIDRYSVLLLTNYKNIWSEQGRQNIHIFLIHFHTSFTVTMSWV